MSYRNSSSQFFFTSRRRHTKYWGDWISDVCFSDLMKQRFGIAQALLANPRLIIVDEPTAGLDPAERSRFLNLLSEVGENTIVILSTHIVEDVKELCTDMAIIHSGQLLYNGQPAHALEELEGRIWKKR